MRKLFLALGVVLAALIAPAAAQAHHLDQDTSTLTCVLVSNVPTVQTSAHYVDFGPGDFPVSWSLRIDNDIAGQGFLNWGSGDYMHSFDTPTTPGAHSVIYHASWPGNYGGIGPRPVVCPTPIPPPTLCNGVPMSLGTNCAPPPPATCNGVPLAPGANCASVTPPPVKPPCGCKPPPKRFHCPPIHLIVPTARHGVHDFGGRCSKGKIVSTTLYIKATGPRHGDKKHGRRIVCGPAKLHAKGSVVHGVWLYDQTVFCHRKAWGAYSLTFVFHVRFHGHVYRCVRHAHFFNHDPGGYPDTLPHAAHNPRRHV